MLGSSVSSQTRTSGPGQITGSAERIHSRSGPHPLSLARHLCHLCRFTPVFILLGYTRSVPDKNLIKVV